MSSPSSLRIQNSNGFSSLLKEGYKHFGGLEEAILKNIEACKGLAAITRTSLGPNGMNKLVVNHLEKLFVTSDAATIVEELEIVHPAAKMLTKAAQMQVQEVGDGSNFVITFAGELLSQAEGLLRIGVHPSEIVTGYKRAFDEAVKELPKLSQSSLADIRVKDDLVVRRSPPEHRGHFFPLCDPSHPALPPHFFFFTIPPAESPSPCHS